MFCSPTETPTIVAGGNGCQCLWLPTVPPPRKARPVCRAAEATAKATPSTGTARQETLPGGWVRSERYRDNVQLLRKQNLHLTVYFPQTLRYLRIRRSEQKFTLSKELTPPLNGEVERFSTPYLEITFQSIKIQVNYLAVNTSYGQLLLMLMEAVE